MKRLMKTALATAAMCAALGATSANAALTVQKDTSTVVSIPGLTNFATTGAMMDGLKVTATFANQTSQTLFWADTGPNSGGVTGNGWSLSQSGDTFSNVWSFDFVGTAFSTLVSLVLDGSDNFTVFDSSNPSPGTDGSAQGANFQLIDPNFFGLTWTGTATYDLAVAIGGADPVGDLFQRLTINFDNSGIFNRASSDFTFIQDTDNDLRAEIPEPSSIALLGLALAALGAAGSRRRNRSA